MKANKEYNFNHEKEYMIAAGMIGLAYAIVENLQQVMLWLLFLVLFFQCMYYGK